jgi:hypothetical protein
MARRSYLRDITRQSSTGLPILKPPSALFRRRERLQFLAPLPEGAESAPSSLATPAEPPTLETRPNVMHTYERSSPGHPADRADIQRENAENLAEVNTPLETAQAASVHIQQNNLTIAPERGSSGERHVTEAGSPSAVPRNSAPALIGSSLPTAAETSRGEQRAPSEPSSPTASPIPRWRPKPGGVAGTEAAETPTLSRPSKFESANVRRHASKKSDVSLHTLVSSETQALPSAGSQAPREAPNSAPQAKAGTEASRQRRKAKLASFEGTAVPSWPARTTAGPRLEASPSPAKNAQTPPAASIHIGTVEVRVAPLFSQPPAVARPAPMRSLPALSRGFTSSFGLRQG